MVLVRLQLVENRHAGQVVSVRGDQGLDVLVGNVDAGDLAQGPDHVGVDLVRLHARTLSSSSCGTVRSRGPLAVTSARASVWYASLRSSRTTIGSMFRTMPTCSGMSQCGCSIGNSWTAMPIPWPMCGIEKGRPWRLNSAFTASKTSLAGRPGSMALKPPSCAARRALLS